MGLASDTASEKLIFYRSMQRDRERAFQKMDEQRKTVPLSPGVKFTPVPAVKTKDSRAYIDPTSPAELKRPVKGELIKRRAGAAARKQIKPLPKIDPASEGTIVKSGTCNQKIALQAQVIERQRALIKKLQEQLKSSGKSAD